MGPCLVLDANAAISPSYHFRDLTKMVQLLLPVVSAILAHADGSILHLILGDGLGVTDILSLSADMEQDTRQEKEDPEEQIDHPPPPANEQPPKQAVPLLFVLGFGFGYGFGLLLHLEVNVIASTLGAYDICHDISSRYFLGHLR